MAQTDVAELRGHTADLAHPDQLIGSRVIIQGASGAGKTYALRRILEETHGLMQHLVLDVEDELFTLREKFDYVLIGGDGADAAISEASASALAQTLLELGVSAIVQLNDLGLAGQRLVIAAFVEGLMKAPRALWHPVLLTLDEAHRYAPNQAPVASSEPLVNLATAGRKRGFGALFATQRLSQLSKDILGQCPNRIMGRVDQALDRRAAAEMLGFAPSSKEAQGLMRLSHEFWMVGPALAPEPVLHRFSEALTTHLQPGNRDVPSPPTPEKLQAILERLSVATELPPVVNGTGRATRAGGQGAAPEPMNAWKANAVAREIDAARAAAHRDGFAAGDAAGFIRGVEEGRRRGIADAMAASEEAMSELLEGTDREPETNAPKETAPNPAPSIDAGKSIVEAPTDRPLGSTHQKVLDALAWCHAAGIAEPGRHQVGWAAGYRADTGHFGNILTDLANKGLIDRARPGQLALTASGRALTAPRKGRFTPAILIERIKAKISGPAAKVLDCLVEAYPAALSREELGAKTGYRADTGHFGNLITELASPEIVTRPRPGAIRLSDWVMLK